jgi:hypothetical protein
VSIKEIWIPEFGNSKSKKEKRIITPINLAKISKEFNNIDELLNYKTFDELLDMFDNYIVKTYEASLFPTIFEIRLLFTDEIPTKDELKELVCLIPDDIINKINCVSISAITYGRKKELIDYLVIDIKKGEAEKVKPEGDFLNKWDNYLSFMNAMNRDEFEKIKRFISGF